MMLKCPLRGCSRPKGHPGLHWQRLYGENEPYPEEAYRCKLCGAEVGEDSSGGMICSECHAHYPSKDHVRLGTI